MVDHSTNVFLSPPCVQGQYMYHTSTIICIYIIHYAFMLTHTWFDFFWSLNYKSTKAVDAMILYYFCPVPSFKLSFSLNCKNLFSLQPLLVYSGSLFMFLEDGAHILSLLTDSLYRRRPLAWHGRLLLAFWWLSLYVTTLLWFSSHTPACLHHVFLNTLCQLSPYLMDSTNIVMTHKYLV